MLLRVHEAREADVLVTIGIEHRPMDTHGERVWIDLPEHRKSVACDHHFAARAEGEIRQAAVVRGDRDPIGKRQRDSLRP
jgi:hypothetical protein